MFSRTRGPDERHVQFPCIQLAHSIKRRTDAGLKTARETFASVALSIRLIAVMNGSAFTSRSVSRNSSRSC